MPFKRSSTLFILLLWMALPLESITVTRTGVGRKLVLGKLFSGVLNHITYASSFFTTWALIHLFKILYVIQEAQGTSAHRLRYTYSNLNPAIFARYAIEYRKDALLNFLLTWLKVNPNFRDKYYYTLLEYAIAHKNEYAIEKLIKSGASIYAAIESCEVGYMESNKLLRFLNALTWGSFLCEHRHPWMLDPPETKCEYNVGRMVKKSPDRRYKSILYLMDFNIETKYFKELVNYSKYDGYRYQDAALFFLISDPTNQKAKKLCKAIRGIKKWKNNRNKIRFRLDAGFIDNSENVISLSKDKYIFNKTEEVFRVKKSIMYTLVYDDEEQTK